MTRILLVDDHASSREPLAILLEREPDFIVIGQAGSVSEAQQLLQGVDIAVVDLFLPDGNGIELIPRLHAVNPEGIVVILTANDDRVAMARAVAAGATAVLHKSAHYGEIAHALRCAAAGEPVHPPDEIIALLRLANRHRQQVLRTERVIGRLTPREQEILQALAHGLSDRDIAERLHISTKTVNTHMVNILGKLDVQSRLQALVLALRYHIVSID